MRALIAIGVLFFSIGSASAYTCEQIRSYVGQVGIAQAQASGQAQGMTAQQQNAARACLGGGKKRRTHR